MDVSQCSHEEAVQRFLEAEEPIMVEVKRRGKAAETTEAKVDEIEVNCDVKRSNVEEDDVENDERLTRLHEH